MILAILQLEVESRESRRRISQQFRIAFPVGVHGTFLQQVC